MHITAAGVLQTGRETVDSEPIDPEEIDWRDVLDEGGGGEPPSAVMRHQVFQRFDDAADDNLRTAIKASGDISRLCREARTGRQTIYDFLNGARLRSITRKKIELALRKMDDLRSKH